MHPSDTLQARHVHFHLYLIVVGAFLILIGKSFLSEGNSLVGLENAVLSRHITSSELYNFWGGGDNLPAIGRDYMPLGYLMEGWIMQNVSNAPLSEKIVSVLLFVLCSFLIVYIWHLADKPWRTGWIPLAFWLLVPIVSQSATQNLIELPHTICTLLALSAQIKLYTYRYTFIRNNPGAPGKQMWRTSVLLNLSTALWLSLTFFFKGFASFYVFLFPCVVWLFSMRESPGSPLKSLFFIALGFTTCVGATCLLSPTARYLIAEYMSYRLESWSHPSNILLNGRMYWIAISQMSLGFGVLLIVWLVSMGRGKYGTYMTYWKHRDELTASEYENVRKAYIFFTSAILGIFAVLFDQHPHPYSLLPSLPMVAFGCAFVAHNSIIRLTEKSSDITNSVLAIIAVVTITIGLVHNFSHIGSYSHDQDVMTDLHLILPVLDEGSTVSVTPELYVNDGARSYFLRYKNITFDTHLVHPYLLSNTPTLNFMQNTSAAHYIPYPIFTKSIHLFHRTTIDERDKGAWDYNSLD